MERVTSVSGSFRAHVVAARLISEGLEPELRGALDGPYRLLPGDLGRVDVFVPDEQLQDARLVLLVDEVDEIDARFAPDADEDPHGRWPAWIVVTLIVAAVCAPLAHVFTW